MEEGRKILLVDDNAEMRKVLRKILEKEGYQVLEAGDGKSAVERLAEKPDLILQDLLLPDITGYDLVGKLRARSGENPPPILALSGYLEDQQKPWETDTGFDDFLVKPVPREALLAKVREHLEKRRGV